VLIYICLSAGSCECAAKITAPERPSKQEGGINFDCTMPPVFLTA